MVWGSLDLRGLGLRCTVSALLAAFRGGLDFGWWLLGFGCFVVLVLVVLRFALGVLVG